MTPKMRKPQYQKQRKELVEKLAALSIEIKRIIAEEDVEGYKSLNSMYDQEWELEQEIKSLDRAWATRDWTSQDWQRYSLIVNNID